MSRLEEQNLSKQMYEWLPYNGLYLDVVPAQDTERRRWLKQVRDALNVFQ